MLVANRGEIACRIIRTARRMGINTVAVFSDADRDALHVSMADEAVWIGPSPAGESYLRAETIVAAATEAGAGAVHPGYGFLSENADFAAACLQAGLVFVGPGADAIRAMGSKASAKALMERAGVPLAPGYHGQAQDFGTLNAAAEAIGFPVLVKASAGGGGKGMRIAAASQDLAEAVAAAKREAAAAFGDDRVLIEKYIVAPRHIEVQIFGDHHGSVVSLFERECTLQRRHQKVVEEAPSVFISETKRDELCAAARAAAAAVNYVGAGTIEFVANAEGFYFLEMNTRLQVEHPVTEMITGIDLVEWQLRVAAGEPLPLKQAEIKRTGHAVEARLYAEDPAGGFLASIGRIDEWLEPRADKDLRIDSGFRHGDRVTPHYDPMLAKVIARGEDRAEALRRLADALRDFRVGGVKTNAAFLEALIRHPAVRANEIDTGFIEREAEMLCAPAPTPTAFDLAAAVAAVLLREAAEGPNGRDSASPWGRTDGWRLAGRPRRRLVFGDGAFVHEVALVYARGGMQIEVAGQPVPFHANRGERDGYDVFLGPRKETATASWQGRNLFLRTIRGRFALHWVDPYLAKEAMEAQSASFRAPMPGAIRQILAEPGDYLSQGDPVLTLEAMKMEHTIRAPVDGRLVALRYSIGDFVQEGVELAEFEPTERAPG